MAASSSQLVTADKVAATLVSVDKTLHEFDYSTVRSLGKKDQYRYELYKALRLFV